MEQAPADTLHIYEGTAENFATLVLENSARGPVLVNYWAPWAGPCHKLFPVLAKLAREYGGRFLLVNVNTDEQKQLARDYGVRSLPYLKVFRNAKVVEEIHGGQPEAELRRILDRYTARVSDRLIAAAVRTYQEGDVERAVGLLREAEGRDPENPRIPLTLARLLMEHGSYAEAEEVLRLMPEERQRQPEVAGLLSHLGFVRAAHSAPPLEVLERVVAAHPGDLEARYQLSAVKLMQDDFEGAMTQLLELVRRDRAFRDDVGRRGLLAVFNLLDNQGALVARYRALMLDALH